MATHSSNLGWKSLGQKSLEGYSPGGPKELDRTGRLSTVKNSVGLEGLHSN